MAKAVKLPSGNWNVKVYSHRNENGKRVYVSFTAPTKAEAMSKAAIFQTNKSDESQPNNITVKTAVERYVESKSNVLSPSTYKEYKNCQKYYTPLNNIRVSELTSVDLQEFVNNLSKDKSPKTVRNIYGVLISSIKMFSERNYKVTMPAKKLIERNIPTDADISALMNNANPKLRLAIALASVGTLRRGEVCALKYKDVNYKSNTIFVHSDLVLGVNNWVHKEIPKTSSSVRKIELPQEIIDMIGQGEPEEYIISFKPSTITSEFIDLRNKLGLSCRFHDLRHYAASILHAIGVPDVYIMERGGWASDSILKSVYRNALSDKSAEFNNIANNYFSNNIDLKNTTHDAT